MGIFFKFQMFRLLTVAPVPLVKRTVHTFVSKTDPSLRILHEVFSSDSEIDILTYLQPILKRKRYEGA